MVFRWQIGGGGCACGCRTACWVAPRTDVANIPRLAERYYKRNARDLTVCGYVPDAGSDWRLVDPAPETNKPEFAFALSDLFATSGLTTTPVVYDRAGIWRAADGSEIAAPKFVGAVSLAGCADVSAEPGAVWSEVGKVFRIASFASGTSVVSRDSTGSPLTLNGEGASFGDGVSSTLAFEDVEIGDWEDVGYGSRGLWITGRWRLRFQLPPSFGLEFSDNYFRRVVAFAKTETPSVANAARMRKYWLLGGSTAAFTFGATALGANALAPGANLAAARYGGEFTSGGSNYGVPVGEHIGGDFYDLDGVAAATGYASNFGTNASAPELAFFDGAAFLSRDFVEFVYSYRGYYLWYFGGTLVYPVIPSASVKADFVAYLRETLPDALARFAADEGNGRLLLAYRAHTRGLYGRTALTVDGEEVWPPCRGFEGDEF